MGYLKQCTFILEANGERGYGHLMRSIALAKAMEAHCTFIPKLILLNTDATAKEMASRSGITCSFFEPASSTMVNLSDLKTNIEDSLLIILDIPPERHLYNGWTKAFSKKQKAVVLDSLADWAIEADLIVIPGILSPEGEKQLKNLHPKRILHGIDYIIIREDIKQAGSRGHSKDLDILIYLHHQDVLKKLEDVLNSTEFSYLSIRGFEDDFYSLLSRAHVYISGFGISFYEALYLGAYPVTLPHSPRHEREALDFYRALGLKELIINPKDEKSTLHAINYAKEQAQKSMLPKIKYGTENIIHEFKRLVS